MIVQQMVLLEKQDIINLRSGTTLTIQIGGADVTLGYAGRKKARLTNGHAPDDDDDEPQLGTMKYAPGKPIKKVPCPKCGKKYDPRGLHIHVRGAHPGDKTIPTGKASKYRGVYFHKHSKRWRAQLHIGGKGHSLGAHATELDAARAYDIGAKKLLGANAQLNFPEK